MLDKGENTMEGKYAKDKIIKIVTVLTNGVTTAEFIAERYLNIAKKSILAFHDGCSRPGVTKIQKISVHRQMQEPKIKMNSEGIKSIPPVYWLTEDGKGQNKDLVMVLELPEGIVWGKEEILWKLE